MALTRFMMDKISQGITGDNGKHAVSTQPLLFSKLKKKRYFAEYYQNEKINGTSELRYEKSKMLKERAEWDWLVNHGEDEDE